MKAVVLVCTVVLAMAGPVAANAQSANGCAQIAQNLNNTASGIATNANTYWAQRATFVYLVYGPSNVAAANALLAAAANALQAADQLESQADTVKGGMPNLLASFKALVAAAQSQNCLSAANYRRLSNRRSSSRNKLTSIRSRLKILWRTQT